MQRFGVVFAAAAALCGPIGASAAAPASDSQLWGEIDVTQPIRPWLSATALGVSREGDGLPNPALAGGGLTLDARTGPWTVTVGDLWVAVRSPAGGAAIDVNVPLAAITYGGSLHGFEVSDRNRVEQLQGLAGGPWRFRNRLLIEHPLIGLGPVKSIFASDEPFYEFSQQRWVRNRAQVGFGLTRTAREQLQIYYLRQDDRDGRPAAVNVLGFAYRLALR